MRNPAFLIALFVRLAAILTIAIGAAGFAGWVLDVPLLKSALPGAVSMKANTAIGLVMSGSALIMLGNRRSLPVRRWAFVMALAIAALGLATLGEYAFGWKLGIDELLFIDASKAYTPIPGRMSPFSALAFACIGLALAVLRRPRLRAVAAISAIAVAAIGTMALLGYFWNASELITDQWLAPVALHTAIAFLLIGAAILLESVKGAKRADGQRFALGSIEIKIIASFIGALFLLFAGGGLTYRANAEYSNAAHRLARTQEVRAVLSHLNANVAYAESAQRNYLITGQEAQRRQYETLAAKIEDQQETLAKLIADNPDQLNNLAELQALDRRFIDLLDRGIALYREQGFASARSLIASGQSFEVARAIGALAERMDAGEQRLSMERERALTENRQQTLVVLLTTIFVAAFAFGGVFRGIRQEMVARSQAEMRLVEAKEAADLANRAKSTFLATMSHEIRTPINGMFGMLELLSLTDLDAAQRTKVEIIRESGKSLLRIINDILDFSRIEAGRLVIAPEVASIRDALENTRVLFAGSASSKGLQLVVSVDPQIGPALLFDPLRLRQILNNFVGNALKFTDKGSVTVKAELIERMGDSEKLRFSVIDTGIGISQANQLRLFQPFAQADSNTTRKYGGTGLGLAISRRLAEAMGGSVTMESVPGVGTTMTLTLAMLIAQPGTLPKNESPGGAAYAPPAASLRRAPPEASVAEASGMLILLVDDHPTNRMLLERQVGMLGYATETAENGAQALAKWQARRFGMVITDCHMPEMDGYELARRIRRLEEGGDGKHVPIIACTANALGGEIENCLAAGMDDYVVKPVELSHLQTLLELWLPFPDGGVSASPPATSAVGASNAGAAASAGEDLSGLPVDRSALADMSDGDPDAERELLAKFRQFNDEDAAMLRCAAAEGDMLQIQFVAHRMNGASRIIGAWKLAELCGRIEQAGRAADAAAVALGMDDFDRELGRVNGFLDTVSSTAAPGDAAGVDHGTSGMER